MCTVVTMCWKVQYDLIYWINPNNFRMRIKMIWFMCTPGCTMSCWKVLTLNVLCRRFGQPAVSPPARKPLQSGHASEISSFFVIFTFIKKSLWKYLISYHPIMDIFQYLKLNVFFFKSFFYTSLETQFQNQWTF